MAVPQLVKNSPRFIKTKDPSPLFTGAGHLVPILSQLIPVHTLPPYMSKMHFAIILPSMMEPSKWFLFPPSGFPTKIL